MVDDWPERFQRKHSLCSIDDLPVFDNTTRDIWQPLRVSQDSSWWQGWGTDLVRVMHRTWNYSMLR